MAILEMKNNINKALLFFSDTGVNNSLFMNNLRKNN